MIEVAAIPFFSIIIPTYNRGEQLINNLKSISNQSFSSFEVIVVDDGGTDNTEYLIKKHYPNECLYLKTENRERSHARNLGLKHARGRYINYFDSDDVMYTSRLQSIYTSLKENNDPDVLFSHYDFADPDGNILGHMERFHSSFTQDILFNNFLATGSVFLKHEVAIMYPFIEDRKIITAEDWELWLRIHTNHQFVECRLKTFALVQHTKRSLSTISASRIEERDLFFIKTIQLNQAFKTIYGRNQMNLFVADRYTFIALTYAINGCRLKGIKFLFRSLSSSISVLKRKRFWATFKKLICG